MYDIKVSQIGFI